MDTQIDIKIINNVKITGMNLPNEIKLSAESRLFTVKTILSFKFSKKMSSSLNSLNKALIPSSEHPLLIHKPNKIC